MTILFVVFWSNRIFDTIIGITFYLLKQKECNLNKWNDIVTLVHVDVRYWAAPEAADILVYLNSHDHLLKFYSLY